MSIRTALRRPLWFLRRPVWFVDGLRLWFTSRPSYVRRRAPFLAPHQFDAVYFDNRANHPVLHLERTLRLFGRSLRDRSVLILGCRDGREIQKWLERGAARIIALDRLAHPSDWNRLRQPSRVTFVQADAHDLPLPDAAVDLIVSESLLEHSSRPDRAIDEMFRVLRPGGLVFGIFGPLYWTHGGAHYLGSYEHLQMNEPAFKAFIRARGLAIEHEECLHYLEHGMFSRWRLDDYLAHLSGRRLLRSAAFVSPQALRYRSSCPDEWRELAATYPERDLLTAGMAFWATK